jgi:hypothetical protein
MLASRQVIVCETGFIDFTPICASGFVRKSDDNLKAGRMLHSIFPFSSMSSAPPSHEISVAPAIRDLGL